MNILIVLTNQKKLGNASAETGFHFSEFSHAYEFFKNHGYDVTVASLLGGDCPITSPHPEDIINARFYGDLNKMKIIHETVKLDTLSGKHFDGIYFAGGHGTMVDFPNNSVIADMIKKIIADGGIVGAVCHGPAALIGVKDGSEKYLVSGKKINCFTNEEEKATVYANDLPFFLESKLIEQGAIFESSGSRIGHVTINEQLITGQNPESVELVVGAMHTLLIKK